MIVLLIIVISAVIWLGFVYLGEFIGNKLQRKFDTWFSYCVGLVAGAVVGLLITSAFVHFSDLCVKNIQSAIPYHTTPDVIYETIDIPGISAYQFDKGNTLVIITADEKTCTEEYTELEFKADGKPCIEVYGKDDYGIMWIGTGHQQKIVIHTEK